MKKACLSCIVALLLFAAFGCGLKTTTTAPDPLPFDYGTVLTPIDLSDELLDILSEGEDLLHLDTTMAVYRDGGGTAVLADGETFLFPSVSFPADNRSRWFLGFDSATRTLYYYKDVIERNRSLEFVSLSGIDDEDPAFIGYSETLKFVSSTYTVTGNTIRDFRGTTLFENGETIAFPDLWTGDPLRFYTYHRAYDTADRGCAIKTYDGFAAEPTAVQTVHDTYTCGDAAATTRTQVAIEILRYSSIKGYALVDSAGTVHTFLFEDYLPAGASVRFQSEMVATSTPLYAAPRFSYEDDEDVMHTVFTDLDFSYVIDLEDWDRYRYADDGHRVLSDYRIFDPDWVKLATIEPFFETGMSIGLWCLDDLLFFDETGLGDDLEFIVHTTVFDLATHATVGIDGAVVGRDGDAVIVDTGDDVIVYDRSTWTVRQTYPGIEYEICANGFLFLRSDAGMTMVELATGTSATLQIESSFPYAWTYYGYLLSYEGRHYLLR